MRVLRFIGTLVRKGLSAVASTPWFGLIRESFTGAWQQGIEVDAPRQLLAFSAVYACVTVISADIGKLRLRVIKRNESGTSPEVIDWRYSPLLNKPNRYQTRIEFIEQWIVSKLLHGNAYILKQRDARGIVVALYVLDPTRVTTLVADDGSVYYRLSSDNLSQIADQITLPAREIMHDRMVALFHPLIGVSPIYACAMSATVGNRIQTNSGKFFENMSRPSGVLSAPGSISDETAERLKRHWEENYSGKLIGRLAVLGDGLKYEAMTIPAQEAQLIEQLRWTVEDIARAFHLPQYKIGGQMPTYNSIEVLNQGYYTDCLQALIEKLEACLTEGLEMGERLSVEVDLDGLLRMDTAARYEGYAKAIGAGWMAPNEARVRENAEPVEGGDSPMMQQQNWSLAQLAQRDIIADKPAVAPPPPPAGNEARELLEYISKGLAEWEPT